MRIGRAVVVEQAVLAAGQRGEAVHLPLHDGGQALVVGIDALARLKERIRIVGRAADEGRFRAERAGTVSAHQSVIDHGADMGVGHKVDGVDFVRGAEPSKKCRNGMRPSSVAAWAMRAQSCASCTEADDSSAKPLLRTAITSEWSPKMDSAWVATARAATWNTVLVSSPAILNILGSISSRPCEEVKVVVSAPACSAPCTVPAAPPSLCISCTTGTLPHKLGWPPDDHSSASSAMVEEGVIG